MPPTQILISAGEASGDMYAARLAAELQSRQPVHLFGMGGPRMREAGVELIADSTEVAVVGIQEAWSKIPKLVGMLNRIVFEARKRKPALAILTDFPGFHLRLANKLKRAGIPVVYFVCPQFWAWQSWRANLVRKRFVRGLCIFPFEEQWYRERGVAADFIGHPLAGEVRATVTREQFAAARGLDPARPIVALLPGSRHSELAQHIPVMLEACPAIAQGRGAQFVLAVAPDVQPYDLARYLKPNIPVTLVTGATYDAVGAADLAIVSSGTATVETALLGTPMVVIYHVSALTAAMARRLIRTPMIAMVNLIAGRRVVPELLQSDFTPERVAAEAGRLLDSPAAREQIRKDLAEVRERLGPPGAIARAADIIQGLL
ncbi:MAG TPA: lipid-A-disaccharide synthase [Methylomirabilota bacterium]|nr:lipid-A-disaccharide synthase [Methylomirabilota bacterium]